MTTPGTPAPVVAPPPAAPAATPAITQGAPPVQAPPAQGPPAGHPRWNEVVGQRDTARQQLTAAQEQIAALTAANTAALKARESTAADLALAEYGLLKPESRVVARALHGTLPEADRPAISDWIAALRSDPTTAPPALQVYLTSPAPSPAAQPSPATTGAPAVGGAGLPAAAPAVSGGPAPSTPAAANKSAQAAFQAAMNSGDPAQIASARAALERSLAALLPKR